jgi:hypothetical protein
VAALANSHFPLAPPSSELMQRSGERQPVPPSSSHASPSAAAAMHVPAVPDVAVQAPPALHNACWSSTVPHGLPVAAMLAFAHVSLVVLQVKPAPRSQPGPVVRVESQAAPTVSTAAWQVPWVIVFATAPTHES